MTINYGVMVNIYEAHNGGLGRGCSLLTEKYVFGFICTHLTSGESTCSVRLSEVVEHTWEYTSLNQSHFSSIIIHNNIIR